MRTKLGWVLSALGVLIALLGLTVMVVLGPDSRISTGPHAIETDGTAVVTAPKVIRWADVQVDLLAEVPVRKPVFVGLGNTVDVESFVGKTRRLEITGFETPWKITTKQADGAGGLPGAPTALDWWIERSAGLGGASISMTLPDESVSVAVLTVGSTDLSGLELTLAYGVKGGFYKGLGLLLLGLGVGWLGWILRSSSVLWRDDDVEPDTDETGAAEEVVYLYVDEDGVEHEISADEASGYEVVEETVEEIEVVPPPVIEPEPEPEPEPVVPKIPGVVTAAEIVAGTEPDPDPEPEPTQPHEQVLYVFIDEDGVEHEVSEDELAEFEIIDEEDES